MLVDHEWPMWGLESTVLPDWVLPSHTTRHPIFLNYLNWRYLPLKSCRDITMSLGTTRKIMFFCHKDTVMRLRLLKRSSWIKVSFSHSMRCICGNLSWGFPGAEKIHGKNSLQRSTKKKAIEQTYTSRCQSTCRKRGSLPPRQWCCSIRSSTQKAVWLMEYSQALKAIYDWKSTSVASEPALRLVWPLKKHPFKKKRSLSGREQKKQVHSAVSTIRNAAAWIAV